MHGWRKWNDFVWIFLSNIQSHNRPTVHVTMFFGTSIFDFQSQRKINRIRWTLLRDIFNGMVKWVCCFYQNIERTHTHVNRIRTHSFTTQSFACNNHTTFTQTWTNTWWLSMNSKRKTHTHTHTRIEDWIESRTPSEITMITHQLAVQLLFIFNYFC